MDPTLLEWVAGGPMVLLALAAMHLSMNWGYIPDEFPIHWNIRGRADRWARKGVLSVFGWLILGAVMACWFGYRILKSNAVALLGLDYASALLWIAIAIRPLHVKSDRMGWMIWSAIFLNIAAAIAMSLTIGPRR